MKKWWYVFIGLMIFIADRITKYVALHACMDRCNINSFLSFEIAYNRGITWGLFYSKSSLVFSVVTLLIIAITLGVAWHAYMHYTRGCSILGEALIIGGSLSNILDRFWYGGVVDFIELSYGNWVWPSFNIADMSIVLGVVLMIIRFMKEGS